MTSDRKEIETIDEEEQVRAPKAPRKKREPIRMEDLPPRADTFEQFVTDWTMMRKHGKESTVYEYLQKQFDSGAIFNPATKRWVKVKVKVECVE